MYVFIGWLLTLALAIEIFNANHTYKPINYANEHNVGEATHGASFKGPSEELST
jgi:hypothetical protein|tara:strand:+ start:325 stop:486 length:162 start_codon:yes stop_codon:yes gene_type:complete